MFDVTRGAADHLPKQPGGEPAVFGESGLKQEDGEEEDHEEVPDPAGFCMAGKLVSFRQHDRLAQAAEHGPAGWVYALDDDGVDRRIDQEHIESNIGVG